MSSATRFDFVYTARPRPPGLIQEHPVHILTKVFAVAAAVLSLVLAALTMAFSVNADRIAGEFSAAKADAAAAESQMATAVAQASEARARLEEQLIGLTGELQKARIVSRDLENENAGLLASVRRAEEEVQSIRNQTGDFVETVNAQASLIESYREELATLRSSESRLRTESLALEDRLNDLESGRIVYEQTIRALQEQLVAAQRGSEGSLGAATSPSAPFTYSGPLITTRVKGVAADTATGGQLVEVAAGSNDRLAEGMRLYVTRGQTWVADLVVIRADLDSAVARVALGGSGSIQAGDLVLSRWTR